MIVKKILPLILLILTTLTINAEENKWFQREGDSLRIFTDRNDDGEADYIILIDEAGLTIYEEMDFNFDGKMDDFLYYVDGLLVREEIDSNYDDKIDLWLHILDGKFLERIEKDADFDGVVDEVEDFNQG